MTLSSAGERQAAAVGERLRAESLDLIVTSPRERTRQTADAIAERTGTSVEVSDALDEIDFGEWTGQRFDALSGQPLWREWNQARGSTRCPGGETMAEAADRITGHARTLARQRPGARIALISHADMLRGLVARLLGLPLDNLLRFEIAPASVSRIEMSERWSGCVHSLNERLAEGAGTEGR